MMIAVLGAVVVGSVGGGLAALLSSPGSSTQPTTPPPPTTGPSGVQPKPRAQPAPPAALPPDPHVVLVTQMMAVMTRFAAWTRDHVGAPCPDGAALGLVALDPWGHPIELTCTDQPADQRVGAISAGADGIAGNDDDVASWTLGRDVTDLVRGARWKSTRLPATRTPTAKRSKAHASTHDQSPSTPPAAPVTPTTARETPTTSPTAKPSPPPSDAGADDIPARR
jgi:hypothetical protein